MADSKQLDGLGFDKIVFDHLERESQRDGRDAKMNLAEAEKELGLTNPQIVRAISYIRAKGYPVISLSTRRVWENDFKIPQSQREYLAWRSRFIDELRSLQEILKTCDAGARAKFGLTDLPVQPLMF